MRINEIYEGEIEGIDYEISMLEGEIGEYEDEDGGVKDTIRQNIADLEKKKAKLLRKCGY